MPAVFKIVRFIVKQNQYLNNIILRTNLKKKTLLYRKESYGFAQMPCFKLIKF